MKSRYRLITASFGFLTLLVYIIFSFDKNLCESVYGQHVFPFVRRCMNTIHWPLPGLYIVLVALLILIVYGVIRGCKRRHYSRMVNLLNILLYMVSVTIWFVSLFYWLWGFNYLRPDIVDRIGVQQSHPDHSWITKQLRETIDDMNINRLMCGPQKVEWMDTISPNDIADLVRTTLRAFGYIATGTPHLRKLHPNGVLLRTSTAGIYFPYSGEPNVDAALHPLAMGITIAHEYAHAYGVSGEGDCNFIAYLSCMRSEYPTLRYQAALMLYRYLIYSLPQAERDEWSGLVDKTVLADMIDIRHRHDLYPDILPEWRDAIYDAYLRSQGVTGGMQNYSYLLQVLYQYELNLMNADGQM